MDDAIDCIRGEWGLQCGVAVSGRFLGRGWLRVLFELVGADANGNYHKSRRANATNMLQIRPPKVGREGGIFADGQRGIMG